MDERAALPDLQGVLEDLNRQFGWAAPDARFFVVRSTSRPRSTIYLVSSERGGGVELVVKTDRDEWDSIGARDVAIAMTETAEVIDAAGLSGVGAPVPLAWTDSPKLVVTRYITGEDLSRVLMHPEHPLWEDAPGTLDEWLDRAGTTLGAYHKNSTIDGSAYPRAVESLFAATRKLVIWPRTMRRLLPDPGERLQARSYLDTNPTNWRRGEDGTVWLLDPPIDIRYAFVHQDVAHFLNQAEKMLRTKAHERRLPRVREAFLGGYESVGPPLRSARDTALLELFRARFYLGVAWAASRRGAMSSTVRQLAIAWQARRRALDPTVQPGPSRDRS